MARLNFFDRCKDLFEKPNFLYKVAMGWCLLCAILSCAITYINQQKDLYEFTWYAMGSFYFLTMFLMIAFFMKLKRELDKVKNDILAEMNFHTNALKILLDHNTDPREHRFKPITEILVSGGAGGLDLGFKSEIQEITKKSLIDRFVTFCSDPLTKKWRLDYLNNVQQVGIWKVLYTNNSSIIMTSKKIALRHLDKKLDQTFMITPDEFNVLHTLFINTNA